MTKYQGVSTPYLLAFEESQKGRLYWIQNENPHEKFVTSLPSHFQSLRLRTVSAEDREWWQDNVRKECRQLVAIPIRARETPSSLPVAVLFVEHDLDDQKLSQLLERMTERLQPVSIVLDNIMLRAQLEGATGQWVATFNGFTDPIAVVDGHERVIRANSNFFKTRKLRCHEMLDDRSELCVGCPMPLAFSTKEPSSGTIRTKAQRNFRVLSYPVEGNLEVPRVVNHYTDITHERDLYLKLVQSEKLAAGGSFGWQYRS